jgi:DNA-binding transcriptional LysR family regulator
VALETNSTHALLAAARAGAGIAALPRFVARWHDDLVAVSDDVAVHDVWLRFPPRPEGARGCRVHQTNVNTELAVFVMTTDREDSQDLAW